MWRRLSLLRVFTVTKAEAGSTCGFAGVGYSRTMPYYAVARGRAPGVFQSWADCESQVKGFSGARYKKFDTEQQAKQFIREQAGLGTPSAAPAALVRAPGCSGRNATLKITQKVSSSGTTASRSYSTTAVSNKEKTSEPKIDKRRPIDIEDLEEEIDNADDTFEINDAFTKYLDSVESRLNGVKKNVAKIYEGTLGTSVRGKRTKLIELPEPSKRRKADDGAFDMDDQGYVQVYTDGACSSNGCSTARAGIGVYFGERHPLNTSRPVSGRATNNCGEIQAATEACRLAKENGLDKICINTDSKFLIDSATKWMPGWKRNNWTTKSGEPVKNEKDFKELEAARSGIKVKFVYVEAHKGILGNERADELAKRGAAAYNK